MLKNTNTIKKNKQYECKKLFWSDSKTIKKLKDSLQEENVSITSTDTILGFLAKISKKSFNLLNQLKGKRSNKPYLILINSKDKITKFVNPKSIDHKLQYLINKCWPGPLTIIFKAKNDLPSFLVSNEQKIAIRNPNHTELQRLLNFFDGLFSSSANKSGKEIPKKISEIDNEILKDIEYIVTEHENDNNFDKTKYTDKILPSTIIDASIKNEINIIREGAYTIKKLKEIYGENIKKKD
ncbi:hypothetical protein GF322_00865 [Candidatus Dependentiae bacterium]|nr:hypothetical protein [Candidatus Dependentiae bacterium]